MRTYLPRLISALTLTAALAVSSSALASASADVTKSLAGVTALELPAKAAGLISTAASADKKNVTISVIRAAVGLRSSATIAIVSAVARKNPAVAPVAAVTAVTLQHKSIEQITKAAANAAPRQAANIVAALIKEFPQEYGVIAVAAAEGAPAAGREILAVVADYVPSLQSGISGQVAKFAANDAIVPVQAILSLSYDQALSSGAAVRVQLPANLASPVDGAALASGTSKSTTLAQNTPTPSPGAPPTTPVLSPVIVGAPFTPPPGPITTIGPGNTTPQSPGGRQNYSAP